jgi:hypothetical protein
MGSNRGIVLIVVILALWLAANGTLMSIIRGLRAAAGRRTG